MQANSVVKRSGLNQQTVQLSLAAAVLVFQAGLLILLSNPAHQLTELILHTFIGCFIATMAGTFLIRGVGKYPGVEATAHIFSCFSIAYAGLLTIFILGRFEYSRVLIFTSYLVNILIFLIFAILRNRRRIKVGVVPEGRTIPTIGTENVDWYFLENAQADVHHLDAIAVDLRADISDEWDRKLAEFALSNLPVYHSKHLIESLTGKVELEHLSENSFGTLSPLSAYMSVKHIFDMAFALIALIALFPVLIIIAIAIRLDSAGPVLFRQIRIGYQGRPFRVYKFRTMATADPASEDALEAAKTKNDDARVTRLGAFLRRSRIDELPQLINIVKGEMSWIGPRPEAEILSRWYESEIPFYVYRHIVRPGITGWAQVNQGHVAEIEDVKSKLHYDFYYIKHFSPWIDLLIVARTAKTMLTGFGAR